MSVTTLLRAHGLHPKKSLGQNFLLDQHACRRIADAVCEGVSTVLEIGPGTGSLTEPLLERCKQVIAIEKDEKLCALLHERFASSIEAGIFRVVAGDATSCDWLAELHGSEPPYAVVGNLPYLVTGLLLEKVVRVAKHISRAVLMVQTEVAERLVAVPSTKAYGALTVFVNSAFATKKLLTLSGGAFFPPPDVTSTVVRLERLKVPRAEESELFQKVVKHAFAQRRKTLRNAWRGLAPEEQVSSAAQRASISLTRRGETLSVEEFAAFTQALSEYRTGDPRDPTG